MTEEHRDGCQCHGCVCSRYELEIHSLTNDIEHERADAAGYREDLAVVTREALKTIDGLTAQLESEKLSHAAWEQQSLLEYSDVVQERDAFESDISTIAQHNIELMQERDALRDALIEIKEWTARYTQPGHPIVTFADKALAKIKEE